jgi:UDP-glucose 4-epimerase
MRVLVTGGSGYIGSHVSRLLLQRGDTPVVVDDFQNGLHLRVAGLASHQLNLGAPGSVERLATIMREGRVDAVIHFAAVKRVDESVREPLLYFRNNLSALAAVLDASVTVGIQQIVVSSSAAVYGNANGVVSEEASTVPVNPYGQSKLAGEWLTNAAALAHGLNAVSLRYFNVAGVGWPDLADTAALNLVPMVLERIDAGQSPLIFGDDYDTADCTCVRDFVHVRDLAEAHLAVLDALPLQSEPHRVYNVGTGVGASVREVLEGVRSRVPESLGALVQPRRRGDAPEVVADVSRIADEIGWRARHTLDDILDSVVAARRGIDVDRLADGPTRAASVKTPPP